MFQTTVINAQIPLGDDIIFPVDLFECIGSYFCNYQIKWCMYTALSQWTMFKNFNQKKCAFGFPLKLLPLEKISIHKGIKMRVKGRTCKCVVDFRQRKFTMWIFPWQEQYDGNKTNIHMVWHTPIVVPYVWNYRNSFFPLFRLIYASIHLWEQMPI